MSEEIIDYLNGEFGLLGVIGYLFVIVLVTPLIIKIISSLFDVHFFSRLASNQKYKLWISILQSNDSINQCMTEYINLKKSSENQTEFIYLYLGLIAGIIFPVILSFILFLIGLRVGSVIEKDYLDFYSLSISISILLVYTTMKISKLRKQVEVLHDNLSMFKKLDYMYTYCIYFLFSFLVYVIIVFCFVAISLISMDNPSKLHFILILYINLLNLLIVVILFIVIKQHRAYFIAKTKEIVNQKYLLKYPYLIITTVGGAHLRGRLKDIFNSSYVVLVDEGSKKITLWNSIDSVELV
jgi:hypothetical protein